MKRRTWLQWSGLSALAGGGAGVSARDASASAVQPISPRPLLFPRDFGAHPETRTEWWYATGWLQAAGDALFGFQITFFRSRTGLADGNASRFAARQLLFAHAALSDVAGRRLLHAERIARWNGDPAVAGASASLADTQVRLGGWALSREALGAGSVYRARLGGARTPEGFDFDLSLRTTQAVLLQGAEGWSRKGPDASQASHYYSQPQLAVSGTLTVGDRPQAVTGTAWLDHEWSETLMHPEAVGWDWIGMNLDDGSALTAFQLRRADGSVVWAGGSHRTAEGVLRVFTPQDVSFTPGRAWSSPATRARYPVEWAVITPVGRFGVRALFDAQELDSRSSTGAIYWEGLSELTDAGSGRRVGRGYLEMTGRASPLRLG